MKAEVGILLMCMFAFMAAVLPFHMPLAVYFAMGLQLGEIHLRQTVPTDKTNREIAAMYLWLVFTWPLAFLTFERALFIAMAGPVTVYAFHVLFGG